jgi:hypothetical protein
MSCFLTKPLQNSYTLRNWTVFSYSGSTNASSSELPQVIGFLAIVGEKKLVATGGIEPPTLGL